VNFDKSLMTFVYYLFIFIEPCKETKIWQIFTDISVSFLYEIIYEICVSYKIIEKGKSDCRSHDIKISFVIDTF